MAITIFSKEEQARGQFDGGRILEYKPVGFPQEGSKLRSYSVLFYWAFAWSDEGGLIDRHPHQGFEIVSFVIRGKIQHYDSQLQDWKSLYGGDAQIIRAGSGIVHAERLLPGSAMFQVWFDPDLSKTMQAPPSYNDYRERDFPKTENGGLSVTTVIGEGSPFEMRSPVRARHLRGAPGESSCEILPEHSAGIYVLAGNGRAGDQEFVTGDFLLTQGETLLRIDAYEELHLFCIETPEKVDYPLYHERH